MKQAHVKPGQRYVAWGHTWQVTRVIPCEDGGHIVEAYDVYDPHHTIRWPIDRFRERTSA